MLHIIQKLSISLLPIIPKHPVIIRVLIKIVKYIFLSSLRGLIEDQAIMLYLNSKIA